MALKTFKQQLIDRILSYIPDGRIRVENALRSEKASKIPSGNIKRSSVLFSPKTLKDWKDAIAIATDPEAPDFQFLAELYENLWLDAHTVSVIESRIHRVLRSKFLLLNDQGEDQQELKALLQRPWFEQFLKAALMSKFTGLKVIELFELSEELELNKATVIPMQHINPVLGKIIIEPGSTEGWNYRTGTYEKYYVQIGENNELGMLADLAPLILAKKMSFGSWLDYIEKYGIAPRYAITDNMTADRQEELFEMMMNMISNHVAVLQGQEQIVIGDTPKTDTYKVFDEFLKRINSEISKRILGQDGTSDNKDASGTYGSIKVLQEVANDRHESDKLFAQYIINKVLFPKLIELSSFYAPLSNITFYWDETEQMSNAELIDRTVSLTQAGFIIDHEQIAEKTGIPIIGVKASPDPSEGGEEASPNPSKGGDKKKSPDKT